MVLPKFKKIEKPCEWNIQIRQHPKESVQCSQNENNAECQGVIVEILVLVLFNHICDIPLKLIQLLTVILERFF